VSPSESFRVNPGKLVEMSLDEYEPVRRARQAIAG